MAANALVKDKSSTFLNKVEKVYMKSENAGDLGIPEVAPIISIKGSK